MANSVRKGITFWGMVGAVMLALKLKDRSDDYQEVASEEGRVALHSPMDETGPYRDGEDDVTLHEVDTQIPGARSKRKRSRECCMCCGLRCGLFWKAFGIVCLFVFIWQVIQLVIWAVTPSPTGLEDMPVYSTSLGCIDGKHIFEREKTFYTVPVNSNKADHSVDLRGAAVGTIVIAQGTPDDTDIKFEMTLRTDDEALLSQFSVNYPTREEVDEGTAHSRLHLTSPANIASSCMRYDATIYLPSHLKKLHIQAHSVSHIRFDANSQINLDKLFVTMYTSNKNNMLLPNPSIQAKEMNLEMTRGWLVGEVNIVDQTAITTQRGDATTNVRILPVPSLGQSPATANLQTTTGAGRSDIFYVSNRGAPHRPIFATHRASRTGDLYLTYKEAEFNGKVNLRAKSYSTTGLQGTGLNKNEDELPWVGDKNGKDRLTVQSLNGWVGLYF